MEKARQGKAAARVPIVAAIVVMPFVVVVAICLPTLHRPRPAVASTAASSEAGPPSAGIFPGCGSMGEPDCPLKTWMKRNSAPALASEDFAALADAFDRIASMTPPGYATRWRQIAEEGGVAARAGRLDSVKAACRACHEELRPRYREDVMRRRAM